MNIDNAKLITFLREIKEVLINQAEYIATRRNPDVVPYLGICVARSKVEGNDLYRSVATTPEGEFVQARVLDEYVRRGRDVGKSYLFDNNYGDAGRAAYAERIKLLDKWIKQAELRQELEVFEQAVAKIENRDEAWMCNAIGNGRWHEKTDLCARAQKRLDVYKPTEHKDSGNGWFDASITNPKLRRLRIAILNLCLEDIEHELAAS